MRQPSPPSPPPRGEGRGEGPPYRNRMTVPPGGTALRPVSFTVPSGLLYVTALLPEQGLQRYIRKKSVPGGSGGPVLETVSVAPGSKIKKSDRSIPGGSADVLS